MSGIDPAARALDQAGRIPSPPQQNSTNDPPLWEQLARSFGITPEELAKAEQPPPLPPFANHASPRTDLRRDIAGAIKQGEATMAKADKLSPSVQGMVDKAVLGICELLGLLFALPFGDDLYHGSPITAWHSFYLLVGILFAGAGPMFPWIRTRSWLPERFSASLSLAALDVRIWVAALLLLFVYVVGPEIYRRAAQPAALMPSVGAPLQRPIGSTFSIGVAQLFRNLPQPCLIKLTDPSTTEVGQTISWILRYGNIPSGPTCNIQPNDALENADKPLLKPTTEPGIVVHWNSNYVAGEMVAHFLDTSGFKVRVSHQLDSSLPNNLIWIDIGPGSPWK